jgi:hypothetical protein
LENGPAAGGQTIPALVKKTPAIRPIWRRSDAGKWGSSDASPALDACTDSTLIAEREFPIPATRGSDASDGVPSDAKLAGRVRLPGRLFGRAA